MTKPYIKSIIFEQETDSDDVSGNILQNLIINVLDSGAGQYYSIVTERWSFDNIQELIELLQQVKLNKE